MKTLILTALALPLAMHSIQAKADPSQQVADHANPANHGGGNKKTMPNNPNASQQVASDAQPGGSGSYNMATQSNGSNNNGGGNVNMSVSQRNRISAQKASVQQAPALNKGAEREMGYSANANSGNDGNISVSAQRDRLKASEQQAPALNKGAEREMGYSANANSGSTNKGLSRAADDKVVAVDSASASVKVNNNSGRGMVAADSASASVAAKDRPMKAATTATVDTSARQNGNVNLNASASTTSKDSVRARDDQAAAVIADTAKVSQKARDNNSGVGVRPVGAGMKAQVAPGYKRAEGQMGFKSGPKNNKFGATKDHPKVEKTEEVNTQRAPSSEEGTPYVPKGDGLTFESTNGGRGANTYDYKAVNREIDPQGPVENNINAGQAVQGGSIR